MSIKLPTWTLALSCAAALALPLLATAKLPAPSPEAKAKADEAKAKTAWTDKVGTFQLCKAQDRVVAGYAKSSGKALPPAGAASTPPCTDPGPYVAMAGASAPPLEAAGAHSPAATAVAPPSGKATSAEQDGKGKSKAKP